jgi:hypothetical protein
VVLFSWQNGSLSIAAECTLPDAATSLAWAGGSLFAATAAGLHLLNTSGTSACVAKWQRRGSAALAALSQHLICIVQGNRVSYYNIDTERLEGAWPVGAEGFSVASLPPFVLVCTRGGLAAHLAAPEAAHGRLQLLHDSSADVERSASTEEAAGGGRASPAASLMGADSTLGSVAGTEATRHIGRERGARAAAIRPPWLVATSTSGDSVAWVARDSGRVTVARLVSRPEQIAAAAQQRMLRESLSLCEAHTGWAGRDAAAQELRVSLGVQLCDEARRCQSRVRMICQHGLPPSSLLGVYFLCT